MADMSGSSRQENGWCPYLAFILLEQGGAWTGGRGRIIEGAMRFTPLTIAAAILAGATPSSSLAAPADGVVLAPHRAIYDLKLATSNGNRGLSGIQGRILYDFSGSSCEGYDLKFRQISELDSMEAKDALSDLTSTTWEDGEARKFRFSSENKIGQKTADIVAGR